MDSKQTIIVSERELQARACLELLNQHDYDQFTIRAQARNLVLNGTWITEKKVMPIKKEKVVPALMTKTSDCVLGMSKKPDLHTNTVAIEKLKDKIADIRIKLPLQPVRSNAYIVKLTLNGVWRYPVSFMPKANLRLNFGTANSVSDAEKSSRLMFKLFNKDMTERTK